MGYLVSFTQITSQHFNYHRQQGSTRFCNERITFICCHISWNNSGTINASSLHQRNLTMTCNASIYFVLLFETLLSYLSIQTTLNWWYFWHIQVSHCVNHWRDPLAKSQELGRLVGRFLLLTWPSSSAQRLLVDFRSVNTVMRTTIKIKQRPETFLWCLSYQTAMKIKVPQTQSRTQTPTIIKIWSHRDSSSARAKCRTFHRLPYDFYLSLNDVFVLPFQRLTHCTRNILYGMYEFFFTLSTWRPVRKSLLVQQKFSFW